MGRKIFIKSIPRDTATKVHELRNENQVLLGKTKIGNCKDGFQVLYSRKLGALNTGLNKVYETKPDGTVVTLQEYLEKKWGKPEGFFTDAPNNKGEFDRKKHTYFQTKVWKLKDGTTILDLDVMDDEIFYYVALESKYFANSEKEWRAHKWPKALYFISHEHEDEEVKFTKKEKRRKALTALQSEVMIPSTKKKFIALLNLANSKHELSYQQIDNLLDDYIENSGPTDATGKTNIDRFMELYALLTNEAGKGEFEVRYLVQQLLDNKIIWEKQGTYTWLKKGVVLGERFNEVVQFLLNPRKQADRDELEEELKAKLA